MSAPLSDVGLCQETGSGCAATDPVERAGRLAEEMRRRWREGERPLAEELLAFDPDLLEHPEAALELIAEELYLRQEWGETADERRLEDRFPRWRRQVRALLDCHRLLAPELAGPRFPAAGETLGDFRLLAKLGRGARGRVFLARQTALSDRPVVLKVGAGPGQEHLSLARLQHTHIVPLYSVHEFPGRGLRALCLPYFGGATLADLLRALRDVPPGRRSGRDLVQSLCRAGAASPVPVPCEGPACDFLAGSPYVRAACWIGAFLADALAYAAERGLLHLDLKLSNVLLAADGQPMLLDFHLARAPLPAGSPAPAWLGGTPAYMAPEQRAALAAVLEGARVATAVDGRADVYALGLLLCEALGGAVPERRTAAGLRRINPHVSPGLAAILAKCLAEDPPRRYPTAAALADDLRRHLGDLPLRGVADRSVAERWRKWRRRRPFALPVLGLLATAAVTGAFSLERAGRQVERARTALQSGEDHLQRREYAEAAEVFRHGQTLVEAAPFSGGLAARLRERTRLADRGLAACELHRWCERLRPLYGAEPLQKEPARVVLAHCQMLWDRRQLIIERLAEQSAPELDRQVRADLLDLAILLADLRVRLASPAEAAPARDRALAVLDEAERLFAKSRVLAEERRAKLQTAGPREDAAIAVARDAVPAPRNAWEHFALGRSYFRGGDVAAAEGEMDRALALEPGALWPNFWKGNCAYRLGRFDDAVVAFSVCVALAPESAWCYSNRGLAFAELGRSNRAAEDFDQALRLDPALAAAVRGRGLLHYRAGRYAEALADLGRTLELGAEPARVFADLALIHLAGGDLAEALACARRSLEHDPGQPQARELQERIERAQPPGSGR
jgi:serine/threonine protein kinase/Tfp pilus assembly protein PilF